MKSHDLSPLDLHDALRYRATADVTFLIASVSSQLNQFARSHFSDMLVTIARIPVSVLFYVILRLVNWRLAKFSKKEIKLTLENYDQMYRRHIKLAESTKDLKEIPNTLIKGETFFVRLFWGQLSSAISSMLVYQRALAQKFDHLDAPSTPALRGMKFKTSKDLAEAKVKGYEYLA